MLVVGLPAHRRSSGRLQAGLNAWRQAPRFRYPLEQLGLVLFCDALKLRQQVRPSGVRYSVYARRCGGSQGSAERLLGLALVGSEVAEHAEVPRMEVEGCEALGEAAMPLGARLQQQEAGTAARWLAEAR